MTMADITARAAARRAQEGAGKRRAGRTSFEPYYKIQRRDPVSATWIDIQQAFPTAAAAQAAYGPAGTYRTMRITDQGRAPVPDSEITLPQDEYV